MKVYYGTGARRVRKEEPVLGNLCQCFRQDWKSSFSEVMRYTPGFCQIEDCLFSFRSALLANIERQCLSLGERQLRGKDFVLSLDLINPPLGEPLDCQFVILNLNYQKTVVYLKRLSKGI